MSEAEPISTLGRAVRSLSRRKISAPDMHRYEVARRMRRRPTEAEAKLWNRLRRRQVLGIRFRRQAVKWHWILDFYAPALKLAIEIAGPDHRHVGRYNALQDRRMSIRGVLVHRITAERVMTCLDDVVAEIEWLIRVRLSIEPT